jgi:glycosyltransferase involved in cell wall biosynthesis
VKFLFTCLFTIAGRHRAKPYDLLHIHNIPDFWCWRRSAIAGSKVILDVHDIVPEFYASKFGIKESALTILLLKRMEWISARFADHVILASHLWVEKYSQRTGAEGKCSVFINNVDAKTFFPRERTRDDEKFIMVFPGGLQWHQGLDIAIRAFRQVLLKLPQAEFHIYGDGNVKQELVAGA